jgi:hypothetical protein
MKGFIEHFSGFLVRILRIGHGLFDTDNFSALGALAEAVTGAIHFVLWSKPTQVFQFWFLHILSFPTSVGAETSLLEGSDSLRYAA